MEQIAYTKIIKVFSILGSEMVGLHLLTYSDGECQILDKTDFKKLYIVVYIVGWAKKLLFFLYKF